MRQRRRRLRTFLCNRSVERFHRRVVAGRGDAAHRAGESVRLERRSERSRSEFGQYKALEFINRLADWKLHGSYGSVGDAFDNAAMESFWATLKKEVDHIWGPVEHFTPLHPQRSCA